MRAIYTVGVLYALTCTVAAAQQADQTAIQEHLQQRRNTLAEYRGYAAQSPAAAADLWETCVAAFQHAVTFTEKALDAAKARNADEAERALERASRWEQWGYIINSCANMDASLLPLLRADEGDAERERQFQKRAEAIRTKCRTLCLKDHGQNGPDEAAIANGNATFARLSRSAGALSQMLTLSRQMRENERRRNAEPNQNLRALQEQYARVQEQLLAGYDRLANAQTDEDAEQAQESLDRIQTRLNAIERKMDVERQRAEDEERLAQTPDELKPYVHQMMRWRKEAAALAEQLDREDLPEEKRALLEAQMDALRARADASAEVLNLRQQFAENIAGADRFKNNPELAALLGKAEAILNQHEATVRTRAELEVAVRQLELRIERLHDEASELEDAAWKLNDEISQLVEKLAERHRDIDELMGQENMNAFVEELAGRLQETSARIPEWKRAAPEMAAPTIAALETALRHAQAGSANLKAGRPDEARRDIARALEAHALFLELSDMLATRTVLEQMVAARGAIAQQPNVKQALEAVRTSSDAAARLAAEADALTRQGANADKLADIHQKRAEAAAAMEQAAARLNRLLTGKAEEQQ
jgi:hypothetical protein